MKLGSFDISIISDGQFLLDGGAMFGVVPKVLWNRLEPADEKNRILLGLNCLLLQSDAGKILIDTGIGDKFSEKLSRIYGINREQHLLDQLRAKGILPAEITAVIMTHMHFDHIGWNTCYNEYRKLVSTFPNASYYVQRGEFEAANNPDPRSIASYLRENWQPVVDAGQLHLLDGPGEIVPDIFSVVVGGHTKNNTIIKIDTGDEIVVFPGDFIPTPSHLKTPYVMGYDLYPAETMAAKPKFLQQAAQEKWLLIFEHSAEPTAGYISGSEKEWLLEKVELS